MFDDEVFREWLDQRATKAFTKLGTNEPITSEEMMTLALKARNKHFTHHDLSSEMEALREDMGKRLEAVNKRLTFIQLSLIGIGIALTAVLVPLFRFYV